MTRPIAFLFTLTLVAACGSERRYTPAADPTPTTHNDEDGLLNACYGADCATEDAACGSGCQALDACLGSCAVDDDACSNGCYDRADRESLGQLHAAVMCASDCRVMLGQSEATDRNTTLAACVGDQCSEDVRHCFDDRGCANLYRDMAACGSQSCLDDTKRRAPAEARSRLDDFLGCYEQFCVQ